MSFFFSLIISISNMYVRFWILCCSLVRNVLCWLSRNFRVLLHQQQKPGTPHPNPVSFVISRSEVSFSIPFDTHRWPFFPHKRTWTSLTHGSNACEILVLQCNANMGHIFYLNFLWYILQFPIRTTIDWWHCPQIQRHPCAWCRVRPCPKSFCCRLNQHRLPWLCVCGGVMRWYVDPILMQLIDFKQFCQGSALKTSHKHLAAPEKNVTCWAYPGTTVGTKNLWNGVGTKNRHKKSSEFNTYMQNTSKICGCKIKSYKRL